MNTQTFSAESIPIEIWQRVFGLLPLPTAQQCLPVCRLFHDLAAPALFSTLHIRLGDINVQAPDPGRTTRRWTPVLRHICTDPTFASYVKHLHVRTFKTRDEVFVEYMTNAISHLRNLGTLEWHTYSSEIPTPQIMYNLLNHCPRLRKLVLPLECANMLRSSRKLSLASLWLYQISESWDAYQATNEVYKRHRSDVIAVLIACQDSLTRLTAPCPAIMDTPACVLANLTHLHLRYDTVDRDDNYDIIFRNCALLQSLSIIGHNLLEGFSAAAKVNPTAFPYLSQLKIGIPYIPLGPKAHEALIDFVASKTTLRCFDYSDGCCSDVAKLAPLLSTLRSLPALETLGLDVMLENMEAFGTFVDGLPRHISALRLSFLYPASVQQQSGSPLLGLRTGFPHLAFVYIQDVQNLPLIDPLELPPVLRSLQFIGHNRHIYDIWRNGDGVKLYRWSDDKISYWTVEDFNCEDWEWLLNQWNPLQHREIMTISDFEH